MMLLRSSRARRSGEGWLRESRYDPRYPQTRPGQPPDNSLRIILDSCKIRVMTKPRAAVSPISARSVKLRMGSPNYEAAPAIPEDLLEQIRQLRVRVAHVLQKAEAATMAPAA
jgi:hypothetical protein